MIVATVLPLTAMADSPVSTGGNAPAVSVIVMRGNQRQDRRGPQENGVIVMRPAPGSFMRETTRLATEAAARDERAAWEAAQEANLRLRATLMALQDAANAVEEQQRTQRYYFVAPMDVQRTRAQGPGKPAQRSAPGHRDSMSMNEIAVTR